MIQRKKYIGPAFFIFQKKNISLTIPKFQYLPYGILQKERIFSG